MNIKKFILAACFITTSIISSCGDPKQEVKEEEEHTKVSNTVELTETQYTSANIQLGGVSKRQMSGTIKVNGLLDVPPQQQVTISLPFGGILANTELLQGMWVNKGQVIATVEHPDYIQMQQDYINARQEYLFMEKEYERQKELSKENISAEKVLQKTAAEFVTAKSNVEALKQKLSLMNISTDKLDEGQIMNSIPIISPISGYVTEVNANIGKFVQANDVLFEIVDTRHLHAELSVFEKDIPGLRIGQKVRFILSNEEKERTASIHLIGRKIADDRTIRVHAHLDIEDRNLLPNTYFKAVVETGVASVITLPEKAIVQLEDKNYIFTLKERRMEKESPVVEFEMFEVQTGVSDQGFVEVKLPDEIADGKNNIVLNGAYILLSVKNSGGEDDHH